MTYTVKCDWCSEEFSPRQKDQHTCSNRCKLALRRAKLKGMPQAIQECFNIPEVYVTVLAGKFPAHRFFRILEAMNYEFTEREWQNKKVPRYEGEPDRWEEPHYQRKALRLRCQVASTRIENAQDYGPQEQGGSTEISPRKTQEAVYLVSGG